MVFLGVNTLPRSVSFLEPAEFLRCKAFMKIWKVLAILQLFLLSFFSAFCSLQDACAGVFDRVPLVSEAGFMDVSYSFPFLRLYNLNRHTISVLSAEECLSWSFHWCYCALLKSLVSSLSLAAFPFGETRSHCFFNPLWVISFSSPCILADLKTLINRICRHPGLALALLLLNFWSTSLNFSGFWCAWDLQCWEFDILNISP